MTFLHHQKIKMKNIYPILLASLFFIFSCGAGSTGAESSQEVITPPTPEATLPIPTEVIPDEGPKPGVFNIPRSRSNLSSIKQVTTDIPAFIGYTEKATKNGQSLINTPVEINSLLEFEQSFGKENPDNSTRPIGQHYLYESLKQFFQQGGQKCYIISVGDYSKPITASDLTQVLKTGATLTKQNVPAMIVIPDALGLEAKACDIVYQSVLNYCGSVKSCIGIFDIHGGYDQATMGADILRFRTNMGNQFLRYGAVYYPWLKNQNKNIPTAGIMAGVIASNDRLRGVWKAPANISLRGGLDPTIQISNQAQESLNIDPRSGKPINAIRTFPGKGTLVWGARTLDGNSIDWRYISVVRTTIMLEESINNHLQQFVFEPNNANTWVIVRNVVEAFLTDLWKQGALAGAKPEDAFSVQIGLGETMTSADILEGNMKLDVLTALTRPAEFINHSFTIKMDASN